MNRVNIPAWAIDLGKSRNGLCALTPESTALELISSAPAASSGAAMVQRDFGKDGVRKRTVSEPR
jgi:hypothetical protein